MYGLRDISTKCRTRYLLTVNPDNKLTAFIPFLLYPIDREHKDYVCSRGDIQYQHSDLWYNKIYGRDNGK